MFERLLESMDLRESFRRSLQVYEGGHPTAKRQDKSECCHSGVCCWRRPGAISQEDLPLLAAKHDMTPQEFFEVFLVVESGLGNSTGFCLIPRRKHQEGGRMLEWRETYSFETPCVFLDDDNSCQVHEVKPVACREYKCWDHDEVSVLPEWTREQLEELGWDGHDPDEYD